MSLCKGAPPKSIGALLWKTRKLTWTCRMGELEPWVDESFVRTVWFNMGEQVNVKMIRDKFSGYVSKFGSLKLQPKDANNMQQCRLLLC